VAVKIRLKRVGAKKAPSYRVVVADSRSPRDGRFIEDIGYYNPSAPEPEVKVDREKALTWLERGAKPSDTVLTLFRQEGIMRELETRRKGGTARTEGAAVAAQGAEGGAEA